MSDINFYNNFVRELDGNGLSNEQIAQIITAQSSRYPVKEMTVNQVAVALTDLGNPDADGIITRLMSSLESVAVGSFLVSNKLQQLKDTTNPGTIDLGNYLQRSMLSGFAQNPNLDVDSSDVEALLSLCEVPPPVTAQDVSDAKDAEANRISEQEEEERQRQEQLAIEQEKQRVIEIYNALYNQYISPVVSDQAPTEQQIQDALSEMIANWPSN